MLEKIDHSKIISILSETSLLGGFSKSDIKMFLDFSDECCFQQNDSIFLSGEDSKCIYFLVLGKVSVYKERSLSAEFIQGEFFGEIEFITKKEHNANAIAEENCKIIAFPKKTVTLSEIMLTNPELYSKLLRKFLILISGRTRNATQLLVENSPITRELKKQLYRDKLTGVYNKTYLQENLEDMLIEPTSLIMMKPDNFKLINDKFGHEIGDATLVFLAKILSHFLQKENTLIRYEGNEFAIVTKHQNKESAFKLAKSIQTFIMNADISDVTNDSTIHVSLSLGIAIYPTDANTSNELIESCVGLPLIGRRNGGAKILFAGEVNAE